MRCEEHFPGFLVKSIIEICILHLIRFIQGREIVSY